LIAIKNEIFKPNIKYDTVQLHAITNASKLFLHILSQLF